MILDFIIALIFIYYITSYIIKNLIVMPFFWFVLGSVVFATYLEHRSENKKK